MYNHTILKPFWQCFTMLLIVGDMVRLSFLEFSCHVDCQTFWQAAIFVYSPISLYPRRLLALFAWVSEMCLPALYFTSIATVSSHLMHNTTIPKVQICDFAFLFIITKQHILCQFFTFLKTKTMQWLKGVWYDVNCSKPLGDRSPKKKICWQTNQFRC